MSPPSYQAALRRCDMRKPRSRVAGSGASGIPLDGWDHELSRRGSSSGAVALGASAALGGDVVEDVAEPVDGAVVVGGVAGDVSARGPLADLFGAEGSGEVFDELGCGVHGV